MRDRFITWGNQADNRKLFSFELDAEDALIIRRIVPATASTDEFLQTVLNAWNNHSTIHFPEGTVTERIPLMASGTIVPEGAEVEDKVRVASAEREWPFDIVSAQLKKQFRGELQDLHDVIAGLEKFDDGLFERLKGAWNKVQTELNNKVLRYEHVQELRKISDASFQKMKELRRGKDKEVRSKSKLLKRELRAKLTKAQHQLEKKEDLRTLFSHLKSLQDEINKAKLSRDDRSALRKAIDQLFKATKSEINAAGENISVLTEQRAGLEKRIAGLQGAIKRMKYTLGRDEKDLFYENKRMQRAGNQLAQQLGEAKLQMIKQKVESKSAKLEDMLSTEADLLKRLDRIKKREEKAQQKRDQAAKNAVQVASSDGVIKKDTPLVTATDSDTESVSTDLIKTASTVVDIVS